MRSDLISSYFSVFGGRVEPFTLYAEADEALGHKIKYFDITSLYPYVMRSKIYPIGFPEVIKDEDKFHSLTDLNKEWSYEGIAKVRILPPKGLLHPVLPIKLDSGKLCFTLCVKCSTEGNMTRKCEHTDMERSIVGVFTSPELSLAIEQGYKLLKCFEVWDFKATMQYDGINEETGLFTKYINKFMKLKQEASGYPSWVKTEADKDKYIQDYKALEGIELDKNKIEDNPGLKFIAKNALNVLHGKLSQRSNLASTEVFSDESEFLTAVFNPNREILDFFEIHDKVFLTTKKKEEHSCISSPTTNVVLAAYITAHARVHLYRTLKRLAGRAYYCDTDSCIFLSVPGLWEPVISDALGGWKSELAPGTWITRLICAGCKNYCYQTDSLQNDGTDGKLVIKGWNLDFNTLKQLNREVVEELVKTYLQTSNENKVVKVEGLSSFERNKREPGIYTRETLKTYRVIIDKRIVTEDYKTIPFGYY